MNDREKAIRQKLKDDFSHYAEKCLFIRAKTGSVVPFQLNTAQRYIHKCVEEQRAKTGKVRAIILKGRQQGCSTYVEGRFYWRVSHSKGVRAFILTHEEEATNNLFEIATRYHDNCPPLVKPSTSAANAKELYFNKLDSGYKVGTAGNKAAGRSSTVQFFHGSEVGFWPNAQQHAAGVMQAIPDAEGTEAVLESTANGVGNFFHQQWQAAAAGESEYIPIFVPWYWQPEYRKQVPEGFRLAPEEAAYRDTYKLDMEQMAWRRAKIVELRDEILFKQEYPATAAEAFQVSGQDSLIKPEIVLKARKSHADAVGPILLGVDPARFGKDKTAIYLRRGRVAMKIGTWAKKDTMEVVGLVLRAMKEHSADMAYIDICGLGAGVYDRLVELGHQDKVRGINSGEAAMDSERYFNKRAEMWDLMKEWIKSQPCEIPDDDLLHAELTGPQYSYDSHNRLKLEKKEDMEKRGLRSPNEADALALTFAEPYIKPPNAPMQDEPQDYFGIQF